MKTSWCSFKLAILLLGLVLTSGCGVVIGVQRTILQNELDNGPADVAALEEQKRQMQEQVNAVEKELSAVQKEKRAEQADSAPFERRREALQAEIDRINTRCRQQETDLASTGGISPAAAPAGTARAELQDVTARLSRLEDWLVYEQTQLRDQSNKATTNKLLRRLRREAYLLAMVQALRCADLPAWQLSLEEDASLQPAVAAADLVSQASSLACDAICNWTDRDSPFITYYATWLSKAQTAARETAGELSKLNNPAAHAEAERYVALAEVLNLAQKVAAAEETDADSWQPARAGSTRALLELWRAVAAVSGDDLRAPSATMLRAAALADYALSDSFAAEEYLAGRIKAVAAQRTAMVDLLVEGDAANVGTARPQPAYEQAMTEKEAAALKEEWDMAVAAYKKALDAKADLEKVEENLEKFVLVLDEGKNIRMEFVRIRAGTFKMGSDDGDAEEKPSHEVRISKDFWMGVTEVTQEQWEAVAGDKPSYAKGAKLPVEQVSWEDIHQKFLPKLKTKGKAAALPTEAEWEYACRAGSKTKHGIGDDEKSLGDYAWYDSNARSRTHDVGRKLANAWGLYDMQGNVWEWCEDRYREYVAGAVTDPKGVATGSARVVRGGSWSSDPANCRSANRLRYGPAYRDPNFGFRLVLR